MGRKRKNGEGTIRKRDDGRWEGRFIIDYTQDGKLQYITVFAHTRSECIKKLAEEREKHGYVTQRLSPDMPFGTWMEIWLKYYSRPKIKDTTFANYTNLVYNHIIPGIGDIPLNQLRQDDLQQFYNRQKRSGSCKHIPGHPRCLSDSMIRNAHALCRASLERAKKDKLIIRNPAIGCNLPPKKSREMKVLSRSEIYRFLIQAKEENCYELFLLELSTGLRRGEVLALKWSDLNEITGELHISRQVGRINGKLVCTTPKTKASIRTIILPAPVVSLLINYRGKGRIDEWMFPSPVKEGLPLDPSGVLQKLKRILAHSNCKGIRFHDLRHTFATNALANNMDVKTLSSIIGHVSAETTLNIYAHITSEMQITAAKKIEKRIGSDNHDESTDDSSEFGDKITYYKPYVPNIRRSGTGCITEINDHLFEGRYTPTWPDGKRRSKNVYARTRAECEQKLTALINEMNAQRELAKTGVRSSESFFPDPNLSNKQRIIRYLQENPGEINKSKIARTLNLDRSTVCRNLKKIAAEQKSADNDDLPSKSDNSDAVSAF